jgi:hypothetical protein
VAARPWLRAREPTVRRHGGSHRRREEIRASPCTPPGPPPPFPPISPPLVPLLSPSDSPAPKRHRRRASPPSWPAASLRRLLVSRRIDVDRHVLWSRWREPRSSASPARVVFFLGSPAIPFFPGDVLLLLNRHGPTCVPLGELLRPLLPSDSILKRRS